MNSEIGATHYVNDETATTHCLERTSPFGGPFIGYCTLCGERDLPDDAIWWPCKNPNNVSADDAVLDAIEGPVQRENAEKE